MRFARGFTLIELLVAISVMAIIAVLSWQGLDGMTRAQTGLQQRADEVLTLQAGLNQWGTDLDALIELPQVSPIDWDGRALRITRRTPAALADASAQNAADEAVLVVAWARRDMEGAGQWLRWQSPPLRTRGEVDSAWAAAAQWAQNPGDDLKAREVRVSPLAEWQIFFYRSDAWTNPQSSEGNLASRSPAAGTGGSPVAGPAAGQPAGITGGIGGAFSGAAGVVTQSVVAPIPEGVRLVLTLPAGRAVSGTLVRDWARPTLGGGK